jgi:hypothetical protein
MRSSTPTKGQRTCHHYPRRKKKKPKLKQPRRSWCNRLQGRRNDTTLISTQLFMELFSTGAHQLVNDLPHPSSSQHRKGFTYHGTDRFMLATFHPPALDWLLDSVQSFFHIR